MTGVPTWTKPEVDRLAQLAAERLSGGIIAELLAREFGTVRTRCAVLGKAHRSAIQLHGNPYYVRPKNGRPPGPRPGHARMAQFRRPAPVPAPAPTPTTAPTGFACTLLDLTLSSCRWPLGFDPRDADFLYCGAPISCGAYCGFHRARGIKGHGRG